MENNTWQIVAIVTQILGTVSLIITLVFVIIYTKATKQILDVQVEEIGLKKTPVIKYDNYDPKYFWFATQIQNLTNIHSKYRICVHVSINGKDIELTEDHHYNGVRIWALQAGGMIRGHLNLFKVVKFNGIENLNPSNAKASVFVESWAANYSEDDEALRLDKNKNPNLRWDWYDGQWIPEPAISD